MLSRFVLFTVTAFSVLPSIAEDVDTEMVASNDVSNVRNVFELTPNPDVLYQPWSGVTTVAKNDIVPPPPPGPYISTALSEMTQGFSNNVRADNTPLAESVISPLLHPENMWPMKRSKPEIWIPEDGSVYVPKTTPVFPVNKQALPYGRIPVPPMMFSRPTNLPMTNYWRNFGRPSGNRAYLNRPPMNLMNQPSMWQPFNMPMSNYPRNPYQVPYMDRRARVPSNR